MLNLIALTQSRENFHELTNQHIKGPGPLQIPKNKPIQQQCYYDPVKQANYENQYRDILENEEEDQMSQAVNEKHRQGLYNFHLNQVGSKKTSCLRGLAIITAKLRINSEIEERSGMPNSGVRPNTTEIAEIADLISNVKVIDEKYPSLFCEGCKGLESIEDFIRQQISQGSNQMSALNHNMFEVPETYKGRNVTFVPKKR